MSSFDSIKYMNVYSKVYSMPYMDMDGAFKDFVSLCRGSELELNGHIFYTVNSNIDSEGNMNVEIFFPAKEYKKYDKRLKYRSYFIIENMISEAVPDHNGMDVMSIYIKMADMARKANVKIIPPFYNEIHRDGASSYIVVKSPISKPV